MKKEDVRVGATYAAKIGDKVVPVRITQEKWSGDKHTGWTAVNTKTNHPVRIKSAQVLRHEIQDDHSEQAEPEVAPPPSETPDGGGAKLTKNGRKAKASAAPKEKKPKKVSGLGAAAQVLKDAGKPMTFKDIAEGAIAKGWKTSGKTPAATLYAAAIREIAAKGKQARFRKTGRGMFEHTGVETGKNS